MAAFPRFKEAAMFAPSETHHTEQGHSRTALARMQRQPDSPLNTNRGLKPWPGRGVVCSTRSVINHCMLRNIAQK